MRIAVFGAGAVGGYFGARLAVAGADVTFIARGQTLAALRARGLRVESGEGDVQLPEIVASDTPNAVGPVDLVIVATKAWQVPEAAKAMRPMVGAATTVLPLQNGVEAAPQLAAVLGPERVVGGLCRIISAVVEPGHVRHFGASPSVVFGELDKRRTERVESLERLFAGARGVYPEIADDIHVALWRKFLFISAVSGLGAVTRATFGMVRSAPETRALLQDLLAEAHTVAQAHGVALDDGTIPATMAFIDSLPADGTPSMQRDIAAGRPSELEYQTGAVVRLGREKGVATPVSRFIYHCLLPLERRARGEAAAPP